MHSSLVPDNGVRLVSQKKKKKREKGVQQVVDSVALGFPKAARNRKNNNGR